MSNAALTRKQDTRKRGSNDERAKRASAVSLAQDVPGSRIVPVLMPTRGKAGKQDVDAHTRYRATVTHYTSDGRKCAADHPDAAERMTVTLRFRSHNVCEHCETEVYFDPNVKTDPRYRAEIDHIVPESLGGTNDLSNLQVLCRTCNARKGNRWSH